MFGSSKPTVFKPVPFGQQRRRGGVPRWVWVIFTGIATGAGGLYIAQEKLLPPRLSTVESISLRNSEQEAIKSRDQLALQLEQATTQMKSAQAEKAKAVEKMDTALRSVEPLKKDLDLFLKSLPPDPRGNAIAIRAGNFAVAQGKLNYHVLFTRDKPSADPFTGVMQIFVMGSRGGRESTVSLEPQKLSVPGYQHANGVLALPEGMTPREITVKLFKAQGSEIVSLRVFRLL